MLISQVATAATNPQPLINEVHPNPSSGSEWVEIYCQSELVSDNFSLADYSLWDDYHKIYSFGQDAGCNNEFLLINVSALNNDGDRVELRNASDEVIDSMTYSSSTKGLSWLRLTVVDSEFVLGAASPGTTNVLPTATPTPTPSPTPTAVTSPKPTVITSSSPTPLTSSSNQLSSAEPSTTTNQTQSSMPFNYPISPQSIKLETNTANDAQALLENKRLLLIQPALPRHFVGNAIMGSLLSLGSVFLSFYVYYRQHQQLP